MPYIVVQYMKSMAYEINLAFVHNNVNSEGQVESLRESFAAIDADKKQIKEWEEERYLIALNAAIIQDHIRTCRNKFQLKSKVLLLPIEIK